MTEHMIRYLTCKITIVTVLRKENPTADTTKRYLAAVQMGSPVRWAALCDESVTVI